MTATDLITYLHAITKEYGNLPIIGGIILDDDTVGRVLVLDAEGCETSDKSKAHGLFLEAE